MAPSLPALTDRDGTLEPVELGADDAGSDGVETMTNLDASVGTGLAGADAGATSEEEFPVGIVVVTLVLIVAGVTAFILGFRGTRRKKDTLEDSAHRDTEQQDGRPS